MGVFTGEYEKIFSQERPSVIHSLSLSYNAELLVFGRERLGGLTIVNPQTGEEIDLPHYRIGLTVSLEEDDRALYVTHNGETIVNRSMDDNDWLQKESILGRLLLVD